MKDFIDKKFDGNFDLTCEECWRVLPNKEYITKNGCLWCDKKGNKNGKKRKT